MSPLLDGDYGARQATYDLRRLLRKGLIARIPETFRYQLTPLGREIAVFFTSPRPTAACSPPDWRSSIRRFRRRWRRDLLWLSAGGASIAPWTTTWPGK